ncbi:MAG: pyruvate dehydrogenase (acetyl-transferring), homodimeric type [Pseudomonadota bacterium]
MTHEPDQDPTETQEWLDALDAVLAHEGPERAHYLLESLIRRAQCGGVRLPYTANTAYLNTLTPAEQRPYPGNQALESRLRAIIRWNAMAMVVHANRKSSELGGHIASFASVATLFDVGFNHFFRATDAEREGDLVFFQGHSAPGVYSRAYLEGRLTEEHLEKFRQEVDGGGLSSYPHPWLMPDFWQFPTVSMGLGPIMAIYQARFMRYLQDRQLIQNATERKVWAFLGDGEVDEPESLGAISLAARERLDNLVFVVNCNLQRLDGPVRGNGKIIQELEAVFRGAGWNVLKVIWGSSWDPLLERDQDGILLKRMQEAVDGDYQAYKANNGAYIREHFFGKYPELAAMVQNLSDEDIWRLQRGGHDPLKIYAAYAEAMAHTGQPTVILAKTVKGYGMGDAGEGQNITHSQKKMGTEALKSFRDRFNIPIPDDRIASAPYYKPAPDSPEMQYLHDRRKALGGYLPSRRRVANTLPIPALDAFKALLGGSGEREMSTTMAFVRFLGLLLRDKQVAPYVVPIVPDEARTFGMEGLFRQIGIYSSVGQLYTPVDSDQVMYYREAQQGQVLQEGINEAGAMSSWIAAATAYSNHGVSMIPFYIYYSMFGFQRIGDLAWAAGDMQARGFLLGGTAGRTTLAGEGLQHQDGHSHLMANTIPNCRAYDPTFAYELAVILQRGMQEMYVEQQNLFYYVTVMNENYPQPAMPEGDDIVAGILRGIYPYQQGGQHKLRVQLLGSGTILREVIAAAELLEQDWQVSADVWSVTSFNELQRDGIDAERWNRLHPTETPKTSYVTQVLADTTGPVIAATDYIRTFAEQIRPYLVGKDYVTLGTDGFGRSDLRSQLRKHFEVNRYYVVVAALHALAQRGEMDAETVAKAIATYSIDADKPNPISV